MSKEELEDLYILLERQYRKAFIQGYNAAISNKIGKKDLLKWELNGKFQNFEIWEDPLDQSNLPVSLQKQNNKDKGAEVLRNLRRHLNLKTWKS
jgi:hypothetical protein